MFKKFVGKLIDKITSPAKVVGIRSWNIDGIYEIDLNLPHLNMKEWNTVQRLKCKVGVLDYRDYTPASWDVETKFCTIYIDAKHNGIGSNYIKLLRVGDKVSLAPARSSKAPTEAGKVLCITDASGLGHSLALSNLTNQTSNPLDAITFIEYDNNIPEDFALNHPTFKFIKGDYKDKVKLLKQWCQSKDLSIYRHIYLTGNVEMVKVLKNFLKQELHTTAKINAAGFWR